MRVQNKTRRVLSTHSLGAYVRLKQPSVKTYARWQHLAAFLFGTNDSRYENASAFFTARAMLALQAQY